MAKIRHLRAIVLMICALVIVSAAPAMANNDDHDDTGRPCGSLFDILEGDAGECGILNLLFPPNDDDD